MDRDRCCFMCQFCHRNTGLILKCCDAAKNRLRLARTKAILCLADGLRPTAFLDVSSLNFGGATSTAVFFAAAGCASRSSPVCDIAPLRYVHTRASIPASRRRKERRHAIASDVRLKWIVGIFYRHERASPWKGCCEETDALPHGANPWRAKCAA